MNILISKTKFKDNIEKYMQSVPQGKVVSYSQVAMLCGHPSAARAVGQIAHFGSHNIPWHRLVHADGALANGYVPGGPNQQKRELEIEGIGFKGDKVNMKEFQLR